MRKIVQKTVLWQCKICAESYKKKSDAEQCEKMPIEKPKFKIGDQVTNSMEPRFCVFAGFKEYRFKGRVSKIFRPQPPDEEYWNKWLGGLPKTHVFWYGVVYVCPRCKREHDAAYYAPELTLV